MSLSTNISDLAVRIATEFKTVRGTIGALGSLTTTAKGSLVLAINEVNAKVPPAPAAATEAAAGIVELATLAEVAAGTDTTRAVTVAGVRQERAALKQEILGTNVPAALDTLDELAAAIADDQNFAASTTTALGNRVRVDAAQTFTALQQTQGRANIDAASATDVGSTTVNYVTAFETALV